MAKRRGNGEGSITKRKNGTWMGRVMVGRNSNGKPLIKTVYGKTRKEVSEKLIKITNDINTGTYVEPSKLKVEQWLTNWLEEYKQINLKPTTYDCYEKMIKNHINPSIGNILLKDLKTEHIQRVYKDKYNNGKGLSTGTLRKIHVIVKSALEQAVINGLIIKNPADGAKLPLHKQKEIKVFTVEEQKRFINCAKDYRLYEAFVFDLDTGLRLGELLALKWDDIDLKKGTVSVNKNLVVVKNRDDNNDKKTSLLIQDTTKTKSGKREIPLTKRTLNLLKQLKLKNPKGSDIVFCSEKGTYISPRNFERTFKKVIAKAKIENCNVHTMRHTFATRLIESGVSIKVVSELLGHADVIVALNTYAHALPNTKKEAVEMLDKLFG